MTDLDAAIRERLGSRPFLTTVEADRAAEINAWIDIAIEHIEAELDKHKPDYCGGRAEYEEHDEDAYDKNGKYLGTMTVTDGPKPPNWCGECSEYTPCRHIRQLAARLGIHTWLSADHPEPEGGVIVATRSGEHWWRMPWLALPDAWMLIGEQGQATGDPHSWATVAGDRGPVRIVEDR